MRIDEVRDPKTQTLLAQIIRQSSGFPIISTIQSLTQPEDPLQVLCMQRPSGHKIDRHEHNKVQRQTDVPTPEVLFVRAGSVIAMFYNQERLFIHQMLLVAGDVLFQICGGHSFEIQEQADIVEVKLGPYAGEADKTRF